MIKVKRIEFNDKKYIFALNANGSIHMWNPKETETAPQIKSTRACFDVQVETDGKKEFICVYHVGAKDTIEITRICPETEVLETTTTDITCSSDIKDIQAEGNEVYFVSNNRVRSFLNKETPNMDVPLPEQFINKIVHIHYKK